MSGWPREPPSPELARPFGRGPRAGFRWSAYVLAVTSFGSALATPLYSVYARQYGFGSATLGLVFAGYTLGVVLTLFLLAPREDQVGPRPLLYIGMVLGVAAAGLFLVANGVALLAAARVVSGMSVGATTSVATTAMNKTEPNRDTHHVARVSVAANFGGFAVGVLASGILVEYAPAPTRAPFVLALLVVAVGGFAVSRLPLASTSKGGKPSRPRVQRIRVPAGVRGPFWIAAGGVGGAYAIYGLFAALAPSYLHSALGVGNHALAGAMVAVLFGGAALTQLATAHLRDRNALLLGFPVMAAALGLFVAALVLARWEVFLASTAALGVGVGLTFMGAVTLADRIAPEGQHGEILAGFYLVAYLSLAVPTIGVAEAAEQTGLATAGILFGVILAAISLALWAQVRRSPMPPGGEGRR